MGNIKRFLSKSCTLRCPTKTLRLFSLQSAVVLRKDGKKQKRASGLEISGFLCQTGRKGVPIKGYPQLPKRVLEISELVDFQPKISGIFGEIISRL